MSKIRSIAFLLTAAVSFSAGAQRPAGAVSLESAAIVASPTSDGVRFIGTARTCRIRVQIFAANGDALFDSSWRAGNYLDWPAIAADGQQPLAGSYRCVITVEDLDGQFMDEERTIIAAGAKIAIAQRGERRRSVDANEESSPKITLLSHDGQSGAVVNTSGDLTFRLGDFLGGKDAEKMRLTTDGKLGIGTAKPEAELDVVGTIRTSKGIVFPDGTLLTSEGGQLMARSADQAASMTTPAGQTIVVRPPILPLLTVARRSTTTTPRFVTTNTGVGIWNAAPAFTLDVGGVVNTSASYDIGGFTMVKGDTQNTVVGRDAGPSASLSNATFVGVGAGHATTTGTSNTYIGNNAGWSNTVGSFNTAVGATTGGGADGQYNSYFGFLSGSNAPGSGNTFIGSGTGLTNTSVNQTSEDTLLGVNATIDATSRGVVGATAIGAYASAAQSNTVILGSINGVNSATVTASVGVGTQFPNQYLGVGGGITVDELNANNGTLLANSVIAFGTAANNAISGEAIASQRLGTGNLWGLDFYTAFAKRMTIANNGNVTIYGTLAKGAGSFKIDDPIDPRNKYLYHSFVESPDMKNIYDGVVVLDSRGEATVELPNWFEALNQDFRYQLTCMHGWAPVYVDEEISGNHFSIAGGKPGMKVSWQVTGVRHDAFANAHRIPVEEEKPASERGTYMYPAEAAAEKQR